ncbi:MAG TPA: mannosyl-3-phosphoglycerate phosphatase, partial [Methanosarcinales archaeon]|nr:mannosyl-3-phosphoglycerate phosphatase [Methanosarcinales archaeon]
MKYIIFTDLDGTLLDHKTYSYESAKPALKLIKEYNIPIIFCTSKTRAEIEVIKKELKLNHPFISENGGAIFIPKDYFDRGVLYDYSKTVDQYKVIELGTAYPKLREILTKIRNITKVNLLGFGDMDAERVSKECGLDLETAKLAKKREYDEAFCVIDPKVKQTIFTDLISSHGLNFTKGGRFYHIMGNNDKGKAVTILSDLYKKQFKNIKTVGLGDSLNDVPMLQAV